MKIKKIIIFILTMMVVLGLSTSYAKDIIPAADASSSEISKYIQKNGTRGVYIDTLCGWYSKVSSDTTTISKVDSALKNISKSRIKKYCDKKSVEELKNTVPSSILNVWQNKVTNKSVKQKLTKAYTTKVKEMDSQTGESSVIDPTINQNVYKTGKVYSSKIQGKVGPILGVIRNVGIVLSVIFLMIIGVQAILGSAEERADYKKRLPKYLIGVIVLAAGSIIPQLIYNIMK